MIKIRVLSYAHATANKTCEVVYVYMAIVVPRVGDFFNLEYHAYPVERVEWTVLGGQVQADIYIEGIE